MSTAFDARSLHALAFDVFGTVVDWRGSIVREGQMLSAATGLKVDWPAFADAWRAGYAPAMDRTRGAGQAWADIDTLHRQILDELLPRFGLQSLDDVQRVQLNLVWHRLMPWPDSVGGLHRLKSRYPISTLSNGNVSLLVDMARNAGLPWDAVLSGELIRKYKPDPEVYLMAARLLGCAPSQLMGTGWQGWRYPCRTGRLECPASSFRAKPLARSANCWTKQQTMWRSASGTPRSAFPSARWN